MMSFKEPIGNSPEEDRPPQESVEERETFSQSLMSVAASSTFNQSINQIAADDNIASTRIDDDTIVGFSDFLSYLTTPPPSATTVTNSIDIDSTGGRTVLPGNDDIIPTTSPFSATSVTSRNDIDGTGGRTASSGNDDHRSSPPSSATSRTSPADIGRTGSQTVSHGNNDGVMCLLHEAPPILPPIPLSQLDANICSEKEQLDASHKARAEPSQEESESGTREEEMGAGSIDEGSSLRVVCAGNREDLDSSSQIADRQLTSSSRGRNDSNSEVLLVAELVQRMSVVTAEPMQARGFVERRWKSIGFVLCLLLAVLAAVLSLSLTGNMSSGGGEQTTNKEKEEAEEKEAGDIGEALFSDIVPTLRPTASPTGVPTGAPTGGPTYDSRPTLQVVQERGYIRCGMRDEQFGGFNHDLCRAVAAVVVGNPDSFEGVPVTSGERWKYLNGRKVDLLLRGDTHTIEREVKESSTGVGFTFSTPFNYDGMVFFGNQTFVHCAEEQKRYRECASLLVCVSESSTHHRYMKKAFPSDYFKVGSALEDIKAMLFNNTCNVMAFDKSALLGMAKSSEARNRGFVFGEVMKTKEPLAIVTRNNDREFSDLVNWVLQALFFGEEQGLTKNSNLCQKYANFAFDDAADLDFVNTVYCVGNYAEIYEGEMRRGMNQINIGTGVLYAIPFGNLDEDADVGPTASRTLAKIRNAGSLNCGVVDSERFEGISKTDDRVLNMGLDFCRTLAAALLNGDPIGVNYVTLGSKLSSYIALSNSEIDVLVGDRIQRKFDFALSSSLDGFHFSTTYYYGNNLLWDMDLNDVTFFSIATREDDVMFASFVNCIVLATIYAQESRIGRDTSSEMPLVSVFGSGFNWALRDAIAYSGGYDDIFSENFGTNSTKMLRGRNTLSTGGPMLHSLPHLP